MVRGLSAFLLILTLFVSALVPVGWMPSRSSDKNGPVFVICTADLERSGDLVKVFGHKDNSKDFEHHGHQACPFAAVSLATPPSHQFAIQPLFAAFGSSAPFLVSAALHEIHLSGALGSRAPPANV
jgi:hypothetical protein